MPHATPRLIVVLLGAALGLAYADRLAFSLAIDPIRHELHLTDADMGVLGGFAFAVLYAVAALPLARAADRGHRRTVIVAAILGWSACTALTGRAAGFLQLFAARVGVGIGEAGASPAALSLVAALVPPAARAGALAVVWFGAYLGLVAGLWGAGALVQSHGWRTMFAVFAAPGLPLAACLFLVLPAQSPGRDQPAASLLTPGASPLFRELVAYAATGGFVAWGALLWDATFYERTFGMTAGEAGFWLGGALGLATAAGTLASGPIGNRLARLPDRRTPLRFAAWSLVVSTPFQAICYMTGSKTLSLACMVVSTAVGAFTVGPVQSALQGSVPEPARATATAVYGIAGSLLGAGLGPPAFGWISDHASIRTALILSALLTLWPALHLFRAAGLSARGSAPGPRRGEPPQTRVT